MKTFLAGITSLLVVTVSSHAQDLVNLGGIGFPDGTMQQTAVMLGTITPGQVVIAATTNTFTSVTATGPINADGTPVTKAAITNLLGSTYQPFGTYAASNGVTNGSLALAGQIGEYVESVVAPASAVSLSSGVAKNVVVLPLTAGVWQVDGSLMFKTTLATVSDMKGCITTNANTYVADGREQSSGLQITLLTVNNGLSFGRRQIVLTNSANVYVVGQTTFAVGTVAGSGFASALRVH